jgi:hypothetical protein
VRKVEHELKNPRLALYYRMWVALFFFFVFLLLFLLSPCFVTLCFVGLICVVILTNAMRRVVAYGQKPLLDADANTDTHSGDGDSAYYSGGT